MILHTNGVCENGDGGFAAVIFHNEKPIHITVGCGTKTSKLQMELYAALEGIKLALLYLQEGDTIQLFTDSKELEETYIKLPTFRRVGYAGLRNPMIWTELYEVMRIAGDRLYVDIVQNPEFNDMYHHSLKAAKVAQRMPMNDYIHNPDSPDNIIRGVQLK